MDGVINVTLAVQDGQITVKDISPNSETKGIGGYEAIENGTFKRRIKDAQSYDIDIVSGATITSEAVISATKAALEQAINK